MMDTKELSVAAQAPIEHIPAATTDSNNLMGAIIACASNPQVDADKVERLLGMYERICERNAKAEYARAMAEMQKELPVIERNGRIEVRAKDQHTGQRTGPIQQNTPYALWEDINEAIRPILARYGFSLTFRNGRDGDKISVTGILTHSSGHSEETTMLLPIDATGSKNAVQAIGSSTKYGQRYTTIALLNITTRGEDDDGAAGGTTYITEEQADQLLDLAGTAFPDPKYKAHLMTRICEKFNIANISMLPVDKFRDACQLLDDTISVQEKKRNQAK